MRSELAQIVSELVAGVLRGCEAAETIHHLHMAKLKTYITEEVFRVYKSRYKECIRMLNGMEKSLEKHLPENDRRWPQDS